jgi:hypothetical protein
MSFSKILDQNYKYEITSLLNKIENRIKINSDTDLDLINFINNMGNINTIKSILLPPAINENTAKHSIVLYMFIVSRYHSINKDKPRPFINYLDNEDIIKKTNNINTIYELNDKNNQNNSFGMTCKYDYAPGGDSNNKNLGPASSIIDNLYNLYSSYNNFSEDLRPIFEIYFSYIGFKLLVVQI